jgi:hypothetical protein
MNNLEWHDVDELPRNGTKDVWVLIVHWKCRFPGSFTIKGGYVNFASNNKTWRFDTMDDDGNCDYYYPEGHTSEYQDSDNTFLAWAYANASDLPEKYIKEK